MLISLALVYVGVCLLIGIRQRQLIYFPPKLSAAEVQPYASANHLRPWTNAAGVRIAWWRPAVGPTPVSARGIVLLSHGNAGSAAGREYLFDPIQAAAAMDVVVLEYPGYADRPGDPTQTTLCAAANELFVAVTNRWPAVPVFLVGESLGTGVTSFLAGAHPSSIGGVLLLAPYNNLSAASAAHFPWLPVSWLLQDKYPSDQWLQHYRGPLGVVLGEFDRTIPARLGQSLYDGYAGPKRLWTFPVDHYEACQRPSAWWREALDFLGTTGPLPGGQRGLSVPMP